MAAPDLDGHIETCRSRVRRPQSSRAGRDGGCDRDRGAGHPSPRAPPTGLAMAAVAMSLSDGPQQPLDLVAWMRMYGVHDSSPSPAPVGSAEVAEVKDAVIAPEAVALVVRGVLVVEPPAALGQVTGTCSARRREG